MSKNEKAYCNKAKSLVTWFFFILAAGALILLISLIPYIRQYYQADIAKSGKTTFYIIYYGIVYTLVVFAFLITFGAFAFAFLYCFFQRIVLRDKTIVFREFLKKTEINLKDVTNFAIGKVDLPIVYSTGYGPMGSISSWDYPAIYYKRNGGIIRIILPWFELDDFIEELRKRAPWIKIQIPHKFLTFA